jgi:hypothetical protein
MAAYANPARAIRNTRKYVHPIPAGILATRRLQGKKAQNWVRSAKQNPGLYFV